MRPTTPILRRPAAKKPSTGRSIDEDPAGAGFTVLQAGEDFVAASDAAAVPLLRDDEDELSRQEYRLNVFREYLCIGQHPHPPRYYEARPTHFPSNINVFFTGGLYAAIHKAKVEFLSRYNAVYLGLFVWMLVLYVVAFWGTSVLFKTTGDGRRKFNFASYTFHAAGVFVVSVTMSYFITRPIVKKFHHRMEAVVLEMSPLFRRAGYDLEYHRCDPALFCDRQSFVKIVPFSGNLTPEEEAKADALWDPQRRRDGESTTVPSNPGGEFRVAVCGAQTYPGQVGHGREANFLYLTCLDRLGNKIDECTWGAVATEMRPHTDRYQQARTWIILVVMAVCIFPTLMPENAFSSWFVTAPFIAVVLCVFAVVYIPTGWEVWWLKRMFGVPNLDEMESSIQRLSPLVEERTGYGLRLGTEPEGRWGGRSTYVYFERRGEPAGAAMP